MTNSQLQHPSAVGDGSKVAPRRTKSCSECGESIPEKRLAINPNAEQCVPCLEKLGDVPTIKRYDESGVDGEVVSTMFTVNHRVQEQMRRINTLVAPDEAFDVALGDDSHLTREGVSVVEPGYNMREAFETEEEELEALEETAVVPLLAMAAHN